MPVLRGVAGVLAGFLLLPLLMRLGLAVCAALWPGLVPTGPAPAEPTPSVAGPSLAFLLTTLALNLVMSAASGAVTSRLAPEPPYLWVLLLAFLVFAGGVVFAVQQIGGASPAWYLLTQPLVSGIAIATGGWAALAFRHRGD